ncbi:ROK family protein [Marisediminicola sp. LYQ134]|uniref:ROK family protein n=1 Tax=unclassified Marisediminicola TaxID=2618316 RepID=UPI0039830D00
MLGIDVGGTTIKGVTLTESGVVASEFRSPTPSPDDTGERVIEAVVEVAEALGHAPGDPVGLVVPGIVDDVRGIAVWSANIGFRGAPLRELASRRLDAPVAFGQDVRAGAVAEMRSGAARDATGSVAFVAVGTGVAAALVVDGRMLVSDGWAGEIGQTIISNGPHAGRRVEEVASASATARRAGEIDALAVARRVSAGDPAAGAVWADTVAVLADSLAAIVATIAPSTIVIGGGLSRAGTLLLDPLRRELGGALGALRAPTIVAAKHDDLASAIGASYLASDLRASLTSAHRS